MATVADACANIQTETERETATTTTTTTTTPTELKLKEETGAEKIADIREVEVKEAEYIGISERELELELEQEQEVEEHEEEEEEEEEDNEVLYDSLELPQIPAVKTSAVAALEQKLTKTAKAKSESAAAVEVNVYVRVENIEDDDEVEEMAKAAATKIDDTATIVNGEKVAENLEEFKRELQDVVDYCKIQQQQQILQKLQKQREEYLMIDDIPEPIKVLDDIISEFEASSEVKPAIGSLENQSEDDGYMSLSRKK